MKNQAAKPTAKKTAKPTAKRVRHLSKKQLHSIYSQAANKAWITIYQNKIKRTKDSDKLKVFRARLADLRKSA